MIDKKLIHLIVSVMLLILAACAPATSEIPVTGDGQTPDAGTNLAGTGWILISYGTPGVETRVLDGTEVTLEFQDANQAVGFGGCNTFGTEYAGPEDGSLSISGVITTEIGCLEEGVMEQEQAYYSALQTASRYEVSGDSLTIWYEEEQSVLNFSKMNESLLTPTP